MTQIHFSYTDSYRNPSRGSLAFMPHRRHAANETEVLPKPFTVPLSNGEVTVNLEPNSDHWVWIITEQINGERDHWFTTIPNRDGVLEHRELIKINPSSLPMPYDAAEPVWWAEMRQQREVLSENLLKSGQAIERAETAIKTGEVSQEQTRENASRGKAYMEQSRRFSYDAKDYHDESRVALDGTVAARDETVTARNQTLDARDETLSAHEEVLAIGDSLDPKLTLITTGEYELAAPYLTNISQGMYEIGA